MKMPRVAIVMGSDSDFDVMEEGVKVLRDFAVSFEVHVMSAHRCPSVVSKFAAQASRRGIQVIIAGAGGAAHLAGVVAAHTSLPVIGVPLAATPLAGFDALLATVQMPPGIPVATVAIGKFGAKNAAILALQIMALADSGLRKKLDQFKADMAKQVAVKNKALQKKLR